MAFPFPNEPELRRPERNHLLAVAQRSGFDVPEVTRAWQSKARVFRGGQRAEQYVSDERSLATDLGIKKKVTDSRNGIPSRVFGDKPYAVAEMSADFHKRKKKEPETVNDGDGLRRLTYRQKKQQQEDDQNRADVLALTESHDDQRSWEQTTGKFLWKSKKQDREPPNNDQ